MTLRRSLHFAMVLVVVSPSARFRVSGLNGDADRRLLDRFGPYLTFGFFL
jgi:hypothetical protein